MNYWLRHYWTSAFWQTAYWMAVALVPGEFAQASRTVLVEGRHQEAEPSSAEVIARGRTASVEIETPASVKAGRTNIKSL